MATLLDYPAPDYGASLQQAWGNLVLADESGRIVQVRGLGRTSPLWTVQLGWTAAGADMAPFTSALRALKGGFVDSYFYTTGCWDWWDDVAAGTGDGITLLYPFGGRNVQTSPAPVVKVAGVVQTQYYTVEVATGDSLGRWRVSFAAGHAPSGAVTVSFMGRRLLLGRLTGNPGPMSTPDYQLLAFGISLQGEEV